MAKDPAFENAGQKPGLEIWRIENLSVVPYPKTNYGKFYSGDSYIVMHTKQTNSHFDWNIHFWLGRSTSLDESGCAAIKSVELDDSLGGIPVQHREVQGHESAMFLSYFKSGIRYLEGGVASGFRHVDPNKIEKRLLQVKGKRNVRVHQVELSVNSMNKGDCFILDAGPKIYVWAGVKSGRTERLKAIHAATDVRDQDHGGRSKIQILDETRTPADCAEFFRELGSGSVDEISEAEEGGDDAEYEKKEHTTVTLHRVSDESGEIQAVKVGEKPLKQEFLDTKDCFILDGGVSGIFVWIGKNCTKNEKTHAMALALKYLTIKNYPQWTPVSRVVEGGEPPLFKQYFSSWKEPEHQIGLGRIYTQQQIAAASNEPEGINILALHREKRRLLAKNLGKAFGFMPDDGSGKIEIWRIENFELAPVDPANYGWFFGGDSYVLRYTYRTQFKENYIIYFWQGLESTQDEKACSALWAVKLDEEVGGRAVQVRVVQGLETQHFLKIFKGKMVIFMGGHASGFKNRQDQDSYDVDGTRLFHVQGTCPDDVRAVQVPEVAGSLNSDDTFVLETPAETYLWTGKGASEDEKVMGSKLVNILTPGRKPVIIAEGEEPEKFWSSIGGKGTYQKGFHFPDSPLLAPRLFHCSDESGRFTVEEVSNFTQEDLDDDDIMILDTGAEVYIWIGNGANEQEKKKSAKLAEDYVRTDPTERNLDNTVIIKVKQNDEPLGFTSIFNSWDPKLWENMKTYEDVLQEIEEANRNVSD